MNEHTKYQKFDSYQKITRQNAPRLRLPLDETIWRLIKNIEDNNRSKPGKGWAFQDRQKQNQGRANLIKEIEKYLTTF